MSEQERRFNLRISAGGAWLLSGEHDGKTWGLTLPGTFTEDQAREAGRRIADHLDEHGCLPERTAKGDGVSRKERQG